ncbi:hypothetical protein WDU94_011248 [Cyamophila willieti]
MSRQAVKSCVDRYEKDRLCFIQTITALAEKPHMLDVMQELHCLDLLIPLIDDKVLSIQHNALSLLEKLMCMKKLSQEFLEKGLMNKMLRDFNNRDGHYKKSLLNMLSCFVKQDPRFVKLIIDKGLKKIIPSLQDSDQDTRASTAMALGKFAKEREELADRIAHYDAVEDLTMILASSDPRHKHAASFALDNIAKYNPQLARHVVSRGVIPLLVKAARDDNVNVKTNALQCLADISKQTPTLAKTVAEEGATTVAVEHLKYPRAAVQKSAAAILENVSMHNPRLADQVVLSDGVAGLLCVIDCSGSSKSLSAIMTLGYLASQSEQVAEQIILSDGIPRLKSILECESNAENEELQAAVAWTLGEIGKYSEEKVASLSKENVVALIFSKTTQLDTSDNFRKQCILALNMLIPKCECWQELMQMFQENESKEILPSLLCGLGKVLSCHPHARRSFVQSGCLTKLLEIKETPDIAPYLKTIYSCFPEDILQYSSPGYMQNLIKLVDSYQLKSMNLIDCTQNAKSTMSKMSVYSDECGEGMYDDDDGMYDEDGNRISSKPTMFKEHVDSLELLKRKESFDSKSLIRR